MSRSHCSDQSQFIARPRPIGHERLQSPPRFPRSVRPSHIPFSFVFPPLSLFPDEKNAIGGTEPGGRALSAQRRCCFFYPGKGAKADVKKLGTDELRKCAIE